MKFDFGRLGICIDEVQGPAAYFPHILCGEFTAEYFVVEGPSSDPPASGAFGQCVKGFAVNFECHEREGSTQVPFTASTVWRLVFSKGVKLL